MALETAFLLNPGRRVRRRKGRARSRRRRNARGWFKTRRKGTRGARKRKVGKGRNRRTVYTRPKRSTVRARRRRRRRNPGGSAMYGRKRHYPVATTSGRLMNPHRKRKYSRRRRNPGGGGGLAGMLAIPEVIPFRAPLPGIAGTIATNVIQGLAAGAIFTVGYLGSGALVNFIVSKPDADAAGDSFKGKWARPLLFAASAGLIGGLTAMIAPKGKKAMFSIIAASGAGVRALSGVLKAVMSPPTSPGLMADAYNLATGMADYIQVEGGNTGMDDYLQVEDLYEAGLGDDDDDDDDEMEDLYEAGLGAEEEVVGI